MTLLKFLQPMNYRQKTYYVLCLILAIPAFIWSIPTIWMLSLSFQPNDVLARTTASTAMGLIPLPFTLDNYIQLFSYGSTLLWFLNSIIVATGMTLGVLLVSTTAGYAFARFNFRGKNFLILITMLGMMVPEQAVFIPLYILFSELGWHNSYHGLFLPRMAVPIGVFMMIQFFKTIPREIEESAYLEGGKVPQVFWHVILPMARPAIMTLVILTFLYAWNDYLWPLVSSQKKDFYTITIGLASLQSNFAQSEGLGRVMASGVIASLPVILLFLFFQRYVLRAMTTGGMKG